jgi:hypothetical protein
VLVLGKPIISISVFAGGHIKIDLVHKVVRTAPRVVLGAMWTPPLPDRADPALEPGAVHQADRGDVQCGLTERRQELRGRQVGDSGDAAIRSGRRGRDAGAGELGAQGRDGAHLGLLDGPEESARDAAAGHHVGVGVGEAPDPRGRGRRRAEDGGVDEVGDLGVADGAG